MTKSIKLIEELRKYNELYFEEYKLVSGGQLFETTDKENEILLELMRYANRNNSLADGEYIVGTKFRKGTIYIILENVWTEEQKAVSFGNF